MLRTITRTSASQWRTNSTIALRRNPLNFRGITSIRGVARTPCLVLSMISKSSSSPTIRSLHIQSSYYRYKRSTEVLKRGCPSSHSTRPDTQAVKSGMAAATDRASSSARHRETPSTTVSADPSGTDTRAAEDTAESTAPVDTGVGNAAAAAAGTGTCPDRTALAGRREEQRPRRVVRSIRVPGERRGRLGRLCDRPCVQPYARLCDHGGSRGGRDGSCRSGCVDSRGGGSHGCKGRSEG